MDNDKFIAFKQAKTIHAQDKVLLTFNVNCNPLQLKMDEIEPLQEGLLLKEKYLISYDTIKEAICLKDSTKQYED